eukprot:3935986-Rhodomonas_salina.1
MAVGRVFGYFTPTSFSTNEAVINEFAGRAGRRTTTMIRDGFGYSLGEFSQFPREQEVLVPPGSFFQVTLSQHYRHNHHLLTAGQITCQPGLHSVECVPALNGNVELLSDLS